LLAAFLSAFQAVLVPRYSIVDGVQFQVMLAVLPGAVKVILIGVPQLLTGITIVICSLLPAGIVVVSAWTLTPLPPELDDQVRATAREVLVRVIVQSLFPRSSLVQGEVSALMLTGLASMVGGAETMSVTLTVALSEPMVKVMLS
jgi:hypothetical protein